MSTTKPRLWYPKPHRAVDWNEKAISKRLQKGPLTASIKYDGFRCLLVWLDGEFRITTREGIELTSLDPFRYILAGYWQDHTRVLDCEVIIRGIPFEEASGHFRRDAPITRELQGAVQFVVFDCPQYAEMLQLAPPEIPESAALRYSILCDNFSCPAKHADGSWKTIFRERAIPVSSLEHIEQMFQNVRKEGYEGLIIKDPKLLYRNGKVTGWWKRKDSIDADGVVIGYVWGEADKGNAGKIVGFRVKLENGVECNATGLTQAQMQEYTDEYHRSLEGGGYGPDDGAFRGRYCKVSAMEYTKDGSLRHPHFEGFRDLDSAPGVKA